MYRYRDDRAVWTTELWQGGDPSVVLQQTASTEKHHQEAEAGGPVMVPPACSALPLSFTVSPVLPAISLAFCLPFLLCVSHVYIHAGLWNDACLSIRLVSCVDVSTGSAVDNLSTSFLHTCHNRKHNQPLLFGKIVFCSWLKVTISPENKTLS